MYVDGEGGKLGKEGAGRIKAKDAATKRRDGRSLIWSTDLQMDGVEDRLVHKLVHLSIQGCRVEMSCATSSKCAISSCVSGKRKRGDEADWQPINGALLPFQTGAVIRASREQTHMMSYLLKLVDRPRNVLRADGDGGHACLDSTYW